MIQALKDKKFIVSFCGSLFSLIGILIYLILPGSEFANSVQHSAEDSLWVLALAPAFLLLGGILFMAAQLKGIKKLTDVFPDALIISSTLFFALSVTFNFAMSFSLFLKEFKLGFVAPFTGLIYDTFSTAMVVIVIWQFIYSILTAISTIRENK